MAVTTTFIGYSGEVPVGKFDERHSEDILQHYPVGWTDAGWGNDQTFLAGTSWLMGSSREWLFIETGKSYPALDEVPRDTIGSLYLSEAEQLAGSVLKEGTETAWFWDPQSGYSAIDAGPNAHPTGLSDTGAVVGQRTVNGNTSGFLWTEAGGVQTVAFGGDRTDPGDIGNDGTIVGSVVVGGKPSYAFLHRPDGTMMRLANNAHATSIDEHGIVQGYTVDPATGAQRAWVWQQGHGLQYVEQGSLDLSAPEPVVVENLAGTQDNLLWDPERGLWDPLGPEGNVGIIDVADDGTILSATGGRPRPHGDAEPVIFFKAYQFTGSEAAETITGGRGADRLSGLGGADTLSGRGYGDTIDGGAGNDRLDGNEGDDTLHGGSGNDRLMTGPGGDVFDGGDGSDYLDCANSPTAIVNLSTTTYVAPLGTPSYFDSDGIEVSPGYMWDADVSITYPSGPEHYQDKLISIGNVTGSPGGDILIGNDNLNLFEGRDGADLLKGNGGGDTLRGDGFGDTLYGGAGNDAQYGNSGRDSVYGETGNDWLDGGASSDLVDGGAGKDELIGGADADRFDFNALGDSTPGAARDVVRDFSRSQGDRIDLSSIDADTINAPGDQAFSFIGANPFSGVDGQLRFAAGILAADVNGDRRADLEIQVANLSSMNSGDFLL